MTTGTTNMDTKQLSDHLMNAKQVAFLLEVSERTLCRWTRLRKGPPAVRIGRKVFYRSEAVHSWLIQNELSFAHR
jgi:predicted DNA-binding transcriptional regulator AlpA